MNYNHKLNDKYNPKDFEEKIYKETEEKGYFKANMNKEKESYCIMMPPPNVTGKLHMGHALDGTIQDILIRFKRMQGYNTLWLPGSDHASIATEMKVVEKLKKEGKTKHQIGREEFLKETWDWTHLYGGTIQEQQKKLGCSCDWEKRRFTLDEGLSEAVKEQFVRLYEKGLIYRGKRMVNWCPNCNTTISDVEVEYREENTHLWHIKYKVKDEDEYIIVATTRPETMLGDTAVAVHPDDERYKDLVGKKCILPIMNKEIPIIADRFVETEFGTGAVKITPAHDMNDYQAGLRHNLEIIEVFDDNFKMGNLVPEYEGMNLLEAREKIVEELKELGAIVKIEDLTHNVGKCERCKTTIEPKISDQWFVKMEELAKPAIKAIEDEEIKFVPKKYEKMYFNWMNNIQDWCISRQLWWGHRIPAYYCDDCGHITVSRENVNECEKCNSKNIRQDEDTLDTWFSSALWPFSTLGWPNTESEDYKTFFPTNVLVTAYDIITFWVSRMIVSSLELTKENPFKDVLIHGIVRDSQGRKMSKTLGNGVDPLEIIEKYGADSLRFSVLSGTTMGNDIRYMPEKLEQASNFANKIWNAAKFITNSLEDDNKIIDFYNKVYNSNKKEFNSEYLKIEDKWILSKLNTLIKDVTKLIEDYDLGIAIDKIYNFIWNEFCDWYIEICKTRIYSENLEERVQVNFVLDYVLRNALKLLHPFMPFVTTEIYSKLVHYDDINLMVSAWPEYNELNQFKLEEDTVEKLKDIIVDIRNTRANMNVHPSKKTKLIFVTSEYEEAIKQANEFLIKLGFATDIEIKNEKNGIPENAIAILKDGIELYIPFEELVDIKEEIKRLEVEISKWESEVARCNKMLSNPGFINKAPESKINEEKEKLAKYEEMLNASKERLEKIRK
ncbi:MAG TPA: valine--tRNA ligase [Clostridiaceae bacterium]|jgi:valyl-tRNA synthetase|nr:valine--tRNA ligase [Clostridium sp.]HJJ13143.1 valine--tRNA ligase [Clostridiaceae bacterium]